MKKLYYTQVEIAELLSEETWTIRYWEQSFKKLRPTSSKNGRKLYSKRNVELFGIVKKLVREDKLSNIGVKEHLEKYSSQTSSSSKHKNKITSVENKSNKYEIILTKEEVKELLQIMQLMLMMIKEC